jgi:hypothetical protein
MPKHRARCSRTLRTGFFAGAIVACAALFAPAAQAAPCDGPELEQPFLDWNDKALYGLAPGGDFESGLDGWQLNGNAATVLGGNPFRLTSAITALELPAGSSATTPPVCVTKHSPGARVFAQTTALDRKQGALEIEVLYLNRDGSVRKVKKAGSIKSQLAWDPTRKFSLAQGQFRKRHPYVSLRFTPVRGSTWKIDDVFIDPRRYS